MKRPISRFLMTVVACAAGVSIPAMAQNPTITALNPPAQTAGAANSFTLTLTGTNYCGAGEGSTIFFNGNSHNAVVTGTTIASATITAAEIATPGPVPVTLMVGSDADCDNDGAASTAFTFTINPPLTLTPVSLPGGSVGSPYHQVLTASGGTPPYSTPSPLGTSSPPFTNAPGTVTFNFTPASATSYNFNVAVTDNGGGSINPAYGFTVSQPAAASASQGTPQTTSVGTTFPIPLQVLVIDGNARPIQGAQVTFTPPAGGASGTFGGSNVVLTDVNGHATAPAFTANGVGGSYAVTASVVGTSSAPTFNLTNMAIVGPPTSIAVSSGSGQSATVNTAFATPLQAIVKDANSNPVPNVSVTFAAPGSGASGTFGSTATVITAANGIATAPSFTANTKAGAYNVTATAVAVTGSAVFSLTNNPGQPNNINATAGTPQTTAVNTAFANTLQATVTDQFGNAVPNVSLTFSAPTANVAPIPTGTFSGNSSVQISTNASGVAIAPAFTANGLPGTYNVSASSGFTDSRANFALTNTAAAPASITVFGGSPQSATVNTAFVTALQAIVKDANNLPVPNVAVTFAAPGSGASGAFTGSATVQTSAAGVATAPTFTANTAAGAYAVTASTAGVATPASFSLTNNPGAAASITATAGTPQTTAVSTAFPTLLQATVKDSFGNLVPNAQVTFAAPGSGASGTFAGSATVQTSASGVATAPAFTANTMPGAYAVTASTTGVATPASFSLTNNPGAAASITATAGTPQTTTVGTAFPTLLQATVKDSSGNLVPNVSVTFAAPGSGASGTFAGSATVQTSASGVATAPAFTANTTVGAYAVTASTAGVATPASFSLTNNPGAAASISATAGTPQTTTVSTAFPTLLQATVKDSFGNLVPNAQVTFAVPGSGASGTFGGSATVTTSASGVATAPVLTANSTSGAYTATASVAGASPAASFSLTNNAGAAATITATGGTPQSAAIKTVFATALQATVKDASGNVVPNVQVTFTAPGSGASGSFSATAVVNTNTSGVAVAPAFTANGTAGNYAVTAVASGVTAPASFTLTNNIGAPATITATAGRPQSAMTSTQYPVPLQATVKDSGGNLVPNVPVTFSMPTQGPSASFVTGPSTVIVPTNASGVATSALFSANIATGSFNATATVPGVIAPALFSLNNTPNASITTAPSPLSITTTQLPPGTVGTGYGAGVAATGGVPPYSFSISSGSLPGGLSISSGGAIAGTPNTPGTQSFGVQVTDSNGTIASKGLTLNIAPALIITTGSMLPNGTVGQTYSVSFQATGGQLPYSWSISGGSVTTSDYSTNAHLASVTSGLPPGLTFVSSSTSATLTGTLTAAGSFSFTVSVADSASRVAFKSFTLSSVQSGTGTPGMPTGPPGVQVSQMGLTFQGPQGGNPPPPQYLSIVATNGQPLVATITLDGGSTGTPAPPWLKARFVSATTPARLAIQVIPTGLTAGPYTGRVLVNYQGQPTIVVNVSFTVDLTPPSLAVAPGFLRFTTSSGVTTTGQQALLVSNLGTGGPLSFTANVVSDSPWLTVTPASGTTVVGSGVPLQVAVNAQGLAIGSYLGKITVAGPVGGSVDVPVSLFVSPAGPIITVNPVGVRFDARAGNGLALPLPVTVLNGGTGTVNWTADLLAGQSWLTLNPSAGQSTPTASSQLTATANPTGLAAGAYYGLIRITDPQSLNSPQYATAVLNVEPATVGPDADMKPGGLFFTAAPGGSAPGPQTLQIFVSSDTPVAFQAAASSNDGASWLSIGQPTGTASTQTPAQITVSVNPTGLKPGVYTGDVSVSFSNQTIRTANITLVVLEAGGTAASSSTASSGKDRGASCAPSQLSLTSTSLVNAFASPAGWPTPLTVRATDDCGNGAAGAQVVATFSNGDPPLNLSKTNPAAALFSGTWAPKNTAAQMTVTINGLAPGLATATAQLTGTVGATTAPSLSPNGTLNNLNPAPGAAVAPGTVAQVFGGGLTPSTTIPGLLPLPTLFQGTSVLVGAYLAPLYSLSDGQLDVQVPTELTPNRQYSILVSNGAAFTLPDTLTTTDVSPGLLNFAQHADFSTISATSPATAGETIILYLVGMGATNPAIASGAASPSPPANVTNPPAVTINGQSASVSFAGLTPGLVGLYQINVQVPAGTASGSATVAVTQNNAVSNTVTIPIQ